MLSHATRLRARGTVVVSLFVLAGVAAACGAAGQAPGAAPGGKDAAGGNGGPAFAPAATAAAAAPQGNGGQANAGGNGNNQGNGNQGSGEGDPGVIDQIGLLIVKNGALAIQVESLDTAISSADHQIAAMGGYASASTRAGDGDEAQASVTYRIPVSRWEDALETLRALGQKVIDERFSTEEVTAQVVDLEARITNLRSTEAAFQTIMTRAEKIDDILTVQAQLTQVRGEIERLMAQKTNLEGQAAFSTLTVTFALKKDPVLAEQQGFDAANEVEQASASLVTVLQGVATAGIWFGIVWLPILLAFAVLGLGGLAIGRRLMRRVEADQAPPSMPAPTAGTGA